MRLVRAVNMNAATPMWHDDPMGKATDEQLAGIRRAVARLEAAEGALEAAREELADEIAAALNGGVRPVDVEAEVPYKREHIRRIARERGVAPLRPPTVKAIRSTTAD